MINDNNLKNDSLAIKAKSKDIIKFKKNGIKILLPEGYRKKKYPNIIDGITHLVNNDQFLFEKAVETSWNKLIISKLKDSWAGDINDFDKLICSLKKELNENEAIIEAKKGKTKDGYDYMYHIYKTATQPEGYENGEYKLVYWLTMYLLFGNEKIKVCGCFEEINMTGFRETFVMALGNKLKFLTKNKGKLEGWFEPFDDKKKDGVNRNIAEREVFDVFCPYNPLSQARELLLAIINHQYVVPLYKIFNDMDKELEKKQDKVDINNDNDIDKTDVEHDDFLKKMMSGELKRRVDDVVIV